jgi:transcriptional regulator with XRE-family HTH domain
VALSQNVVVNFLTKFDKKGLERATKELQGFDKTVAKSKRALKAGLYAGAIAAGFALASLGKNSIQAALAQEKLDKQLRLTLQSIGAEGLLPNVKDFLEGLQRVTNVTEEVLLPALRQLVAQTGDLDSSQFLLQKALDVSAGTGADLGTVIDALTKAAVGNTKAIGNLGLGFTAAEAQAMGFEKLLLNLDKYNGAAEASTKTFAGQLEAFKISAGSATEKLGTGFLIASSYIVTGTGDLKTFGIELEKIGLGVGDVFIGLGKSIDEKGVLKTLFTSFKDLGEEGFRVRQKQFLQEKGYLGLSQQTIDALELQEKFGKKKLTQEQLAKKIQTDILARQKAQTKEQTAQAALAKQKTKIEGMFDLEKINLQAALTRKLTGEDELRVKILQKLADGTQAAVNEAQKYADVLKVIEDGQITTAEIDYLAKTWGMTNLAVDLYLKKLFDANAELAKMRGFIISQVPTTNLAAPAGLTMAGGAPLGVGGTGIYGSFAMSPQDLDFSKMIARVPLAEGGIVTRPTNALIGEAGAEAVIPLDRMGEMGNRVTVNVAGSVISEGQLQSVIQDVLYNLNRTGAVTQLANLGR